MKQTIYLIRHGNTIGTETGLFYGSTDLPLTEQGFEQLCEMALAGIYPDPSGASLYTTGMLRTEQTFKAIYGDAEHEAEPLLKEIDLGRFEMCEVKDILSNEYGRAWLKGEIEDPEFEGGDSLSGFTERIRRGIRKILERDRDCGIERSIIVAHGGTIVYTMEEFFPGRFKDVWDWTPEPGSGYAVLFEDGEPAGWEPIGDTGFRAVPAVPEDLQSMMTA
jgi:broad specificity phosphatase PhoE